MAGEERRAGTEGPATRETCPESPQAVQDTQGQVTESSLGHTPRGFAFLEALPGVCTCSGPCVCCWGRPRQARRDPTGRRSLPFLCQLASPGLLAKWAEPEATSAKRGSPSEPPWRSQTTSHDRKGGGRPSVMSLENDPALCPFPEQ